MIPKILGNLLNTSLLKLQLYIFVLNTTILLYGSLQFWEPTEWADDPKMKFSLINVINKHFLLCLISVCSNFLQLSWRRPSPPRAEEWGASWVWPTASMASWGPTSFLFMGNARAS